MRTILQNGKVFTECGLRAMDIAICGDRLIVPFHKKDIDHKKDKVFDFENKLILPGFVDVHVHFREPGFLYKESIKTGSMSAAAGGFTTVFTMPNVNPPPSDYVSLKKQLNIIERDALVNVIPFGSITANQSGRGDLSKMEELSPYIAGFSDDGVGVQDETLMEQAMCEAQRLGKVISAHCEDELLNNAPYIGTSALSESEQAKRDILLAKKTGCKYHICHVSSKETVDAVRAAKSDGVDISCETAPHYIAFSDEKIKREGRFKMNPPIRTEIDRQALIEGIVDGTIDMIATDHAPHNIAEKTKNFQDSSFGVVGLETAFPAIYTYLVAEGIISFERLVELMSIAPRKRFNLGGAFIENGATADITIVDLADEWTVDSKAFKTKGRATPFEGLKLKGKVYATFVKGEIVYFDGEIVK